MLNMHVFIKCVMSNVSSAMAYVAELSCFSIHPCFAQIYYNYATLAFYCVI